jgi:alanyl-tRNA synthetase
LVAGARPVAGIPVVVARLDGLDAEGLRAVVDSVRERLGSGVVVHAGKLVQEVAKAVGGGGGGRPDLAQAGGKNPAELDRALEGVYDLVARAAGG